MQGTGCTAEGCWGLRGAHPTTVRAPTRGLRCERHGNKSVYALQTVPQRLACGEGDQRRGRAAHHRLSFALLKPLGCEEAAGRASHPRPSAEPGPAPGSSTEGLGRNGRYRRIGVKPGFWCWGKSRSAEPARSSLLSDLSAQREFNSVTDFSYMYVYKKLFEVERGRSVCA